MLLARLRGEVGSGRSNDPRDILGLKRAFAALGRMRPPDGGFSEFIDKPLADTIERFQADRGLMIDGFLRPGGETERNIRRELGGGPKEKRFDVRTLNLSGPVGNGRDNPERDVQAVGRALGRLGLFTFDRTSEPPPLITKGLDDAIQAFQRRAGLRVDGNLDPGGETIRALAAAVSRAEGTGAAPAPRRRTTILTAGLRFAADEGDDDDTPEKPEKPGPGKPDKPDKPGPGKPEKPEKPEEDPCEGLFDKLQQAIKELEAVRQEMFIIQARIDALKDEIERLRNARDGDVSSTVDRVPGGGGRRGGGALRRVVQIGGKFLPLVTAAIAVRNNLAAMNRAQLIAAAQRELAALEQKLEMLKVKERDRAINQKTLERALAECKNGNKDAERGP